VIESILECLQQRNIRATFFLQGRWVEGNPRVAKRIAAAGHVIGSHSHYHVRMPLLTDTGFKTDVRSAERAIRRVCGVEPQPFFRSPFGAGATDPRTHRLLALLGYREVGWNVTTGDWLTGMSGERLARETSAKVTEVGGEAILLFHSWPRATGLALPRVIDDLKARRAVFVGVDELPDR
jgi:peptidoglycan-N-acetylglucosamine deacetylase